MCALIAGAATCNFLVEWTEVIHQASCIIDSVPFAGEVSNYPFEVSNFVLQLGQPRCSNRDANRWMKRKQYRRIEQARRVLAVGSDPLGGWVWLAAPIAPVRRVSLERVRRRRRAYRGGSRCCGRRKFQRKPIRSHDGFMHRISGTHFLNKQ